MFDVLKPQFRWSTRNWHRPNTCILSSLLVGLDLVWELGWNNFLQNISLALFSGYIEPSFYIFSAVVFLNKFWVFFCTDVMYTLYHTRWKNLWLPSLLRFTFLMYLRPVLIESFLLHYSLCLIFCSFSSVFRDSVVHLHSSLTVS